MSIDTNQCKPGLRERKKQQTRETIARTALQLFAERGYDETTLAEIAEAADVSPRTIFGYYESKEDILFCEEPGYLEALKRKLDERAPGTTTIDALREFLSSLEPPDEPARLRKQIVTANPTLQMRMRARLAQLEPLLAESIARDLGSSSDDVRPQLIGASMMAALMAVHDRLFEAALTDELTSHEDAMRILDQALEFLRAGFEALQDR
jgi:AcrR family transcriptional regulator